MWKSGKKHNKYIGTHKYHKIGKNGNIYNKTKKLRWSTKILVKINQD